MIDKVRFTGSWFMHEDVYEFFILMGFDLSRLKVKKITHQAGVSYPIYLSLVPGLYQADRDELKREIANKMLLIPTNDGFYTSEMLNPLALFLFN